ncbi:MAG: flagellar basal-body MS-ring/collar protein FliF [Geminicoccaceae bacterium]
MDQAATNMEAAGGGLPAVPAQGGVMALLRSLGPGRIVALGVVAVLLLGFFAFVITRATQSPYALLFAGLEPADAQQLTERLDAMGVPYRLSDRGDAVMVPENDVLHLRMTLAEQGLPGGDTVGYELFDRGSPFGTTDFVANVNLLRAVEGELARTIGTLRPVRSARVHIVQPKRDLFSREAAKPTASIVLSLNGGGLDRKQIEAIQHLVAAAVPGLTPDNVTIVDDRGALLAGGEGDGPDGLLGDKALDYRASYENRLKTKLVQLLERTLGHDRAAAEVTADFDFDELATTSETFDPNGQVVRSTQTSEEQNDSTETKAQQPVTVTNNLPTERQQGGGSAPGTSEKTAKQDETINYEISRTVRNQTRRGAVLRRLYVAVQVDGTFAQGQDGSSSFVPRSPDEIAQIKALVRSAAGIDEQRGDVLEVVSRPFAAAEPTPEAADPGPGIDWWRLGELGGLGLLTLAVLLFGVRPLVAALRPPAPDTPPARLGADGRALLAQGAGDATIEVDRGGNPVVREGAASERAGSGAAATVDLLQVEGKVRASLVADLAGIIEERPEEAVRVVRGWLHGG